MALGSMPGEIILQVVSYLNTHDLSQLVLVSKDYYSLFVAVLYNRVSLPLNTYWNDAFRIVDGDERNPVRRFTQALIENPRLAPLTRSLTLYPSDCLKEQSRTTPLPALPEEKYRAFMLPYGDAKRKHRRKYHAWRRDLQLHQERQDMYRDPWIYEDAWLALLLVQGYTTHSERVIQWAKNPELGILTRLARVSLRDGPVWHCDGGIEAVPLKRMLPYLRIPSVRKLYICNPGDSPLPRKLRHDPAVALSLTHLDLEGPHDTLSSLPRLLKWCPHLESLTIEVDQCWGWRGWIDVSQLYRPLQRSRSSLRHLSIALARHGLETPQDAEHPSPVFFGDLTAFPILHTVRMRWANLLPFFHSTHALQPATPLRTLLPRSLQSLFIEDCLMQASWALAEELDDLLMYRRDEDGLPSLQRLFLQFAPTERHSAGRDALSSSSSSKKKKDPDPHLFAWENRLCGLHGGVRGVGGVPGGDRARRERALPAGRGAEA
ncbi:hypothetical protein ASPACDRAFT_61784 [Aspergillus aculeatus ATCC 16872]|uniref:F-box domain-containing protein n=1 Tax=Aspergillus aculeatus (strain ATCC 16872 / CBS 172.66 / WB 5094) TaxID=690307 RepID=A0A1L9WQ03_ASPA1|nr:uncharacterized protein ASPACDRAFT_61784 [Aspergillus aculeatus ATCC 16872]OJJ98254.1 hypothetical protein ASPACDRAFT_61784 [Aspergillus aculeatus ATCC 16872]